jgi:predicted amidohydrolase
VTSTVIACCQLAPVLGDPAANRELAATVVSEAAKRGASVAVLPELMSSGYVFKSRAEAAACAEAADGETVGLWARLAADFGIVIVGGFCEAVNGDVYNSAALVDRSGLRSVYRKAHLWDNERLWFSVGCAEPPVVDTEFGQIGMMICYDLEFPEWVRLPALDGAQLLCAPTNWPESPRPNGERPAEVVRVQADAAVNRMFIAACDRAGEERGVRWVGGSDNVDADGWPLASAFQPAGAVSDTIYAACELGDALNKTIGSSNNVQTDRRPELYRRISDGLVTERTSAM